MSGILQDIQKDYWNALPSDLGPCAYMHVLHFFYYQGWLDHNHSDWLLAFIREASMHKHEPDFARTIQCVSKLLQEIGEEGMKRGIIPAVCRSIASEPLATANGWVQ